MTNIPIQKNPRLDTSTSGGGKSKIRVETEPNKAFRSPPDYLGPASHNYQQAPPTMQKVLDMNTCEQVTMLSDSSSDSEEEFPPCIVEEELDDGDSLTESLIKGSPRGVGPDSFIPICLLGSGSFGEVYLVRKKDT